MGAASGRRLLACVGLELLVLTGLLAFLATRDPLGPQQPARGRSAAAAWGPGRIVHQSWKTSQLAPRFRRWRATWRACFPGWRHLLWTDAMNEALVKRAVPWFHATYARDLGRFPICRADAARYVYMHEFGGIYTDLDNVCLRPFQHLLDGCGVLVGRMRTLRGPGDAFGYYENSFMYSVPGHPIWIRLLRDVQANAAAAAAAATGGDSEEASARIPEEICGPVALTRALRAAVSGDAAAGADGGGGWGRICLAPPEQFNPFSWVADNVTAGPCRDLNRMTDAEEAACVRRHRGSFVLQFHTQVWKSGRPV